MFNPVVVPEEKNGSRHHDGPQSMASDEILNCLGRPLSGALWQFLKRTAEELALPSTLFISVHLCTREERRQPNHTRSSTLATRFVVCSLFYIAVEWCPRHWIPKIRGVSDHFSDHPVTFCTNQDPEKFVPRRIRPF